MLLRQSQRSSFPIRHLLYFADTFVEDLGGHFGETGLLFYEVDFAEVSLRVNEVLDVPYKLEPGKLTSELINIAMKSEPNNCRIRVFEYFAQSEIQEFTIFQSDQVN